MGNDKYVDEKQKFIEENIGKDNLLMRPCTKDVVEVVTMHFAHEEAKGTIAIERCGYGSYIWVNGKCIAMVDLFHCSDEESENNGDGPYFQLIMYDREGDNATAAFKFKKDKSEFVPDDRTEPLWTFNDYPEGITNQPGSTSGGCYQQQIAEKASNNPDNLTLSELEIISNFAPEGYPFHNLTLDKKWNGFLQFLYDNGIKSKDFNTYTVADAKKLLAEKNMAGKMLPKPLDNDYPDIDPNSEIPAWYINADDRPVKTVASDAMGCRGPYSETEVSELTGTDYSYLKDAIQGKPVFTPDYPESRYKS